MIDLKQNLITMNKPHRSMHVEICCVARVELEMIRPIKLV